MKKIILFISLLFFITVNSQNIYGAERSADKEDNKRSADSTPESQNQQKKPRTHKDEDYNYTIVPISQNNVSILYDIGNNLDHPLVVQQKKLIMQFTGYSKNIFAALEKANDGVCMSYLAIPIIHGDIRASIKAMSYAFIEAADSCENTLNSIGIQSQDIQRDIESTFVALFHNISEEKEINQQIQSWGESAQEIAKQSNDVKVQLTSLRGSCKDLAQKTISEQSQYIREAIEEQEKCSQKIEDTNNKLMEEIEKLDEEEREIEKTILSRESGVTSWAIFHDAIGRYIGGMGLGIIERYKDEINRLNKIKEEKESKIKEIKNKRDEISQDIKKSASIISNLREGKSTNNDSIIINGLGISRKSLDIAILEIGDIANYWNKLAMQYNSMGKSNVGSQIAQFINKEKEIPLGISRAFLEYHAKWGAMVSISNKYLMGSKLPKESMKSSIIMSEQLTYEERIKEQKKLESKVKEDKYNYYFDS